MLRTVSLLIFLVALTTAKRIINIYDLPRDRAHLDLHFCWDASEQAPADRPSLLAFHPARAAGKGWRCGVVGQVLSESPRSAARVASVQSKGVASLTRPPHGDAEVSACASCDHGRGGADRAPRLPRQRRAPARAPARSPKQQPQLPLLPEEPTAARYRR